MVKLYKCSDGDRIDIIVAQEYGSLDMLKDVLSENPHLNKGSLLLKMGTIIALPPIKEKVHSKKKKGLLW